MPIQDYYGMIADDLAYNGTPDDIDLGNTKAGPGNPINIWVKGDGIVGATGLTVTDGATTTAGDALMTIVCTAAEINAGIGFQVPENVQRYLKVALAGTVSAGSWSCGVVQNGGQSNP